MSTKTTNVINFSLSKDLNYDVRVRIHSLKGVSTSLLYETITSNYITTNGTDYTDILIQEKLKKNLSYFDIVAEIYVESSIGSMMTVPVSVGLSGEVDKKYCKSSSNSPVEQFYQDDTFVRFKTFNSSVNTTKSTSSSSLLNSSNSIATREDDTDWIQLPIEYSKLPIAASIVFKFWCYDIQNNERKFLCSGRSRVFDDTSSTLINKRIVVPLHTTSDDNSLIEVDSSNKTEEIIIDSLNNDENSPKWLTELTDKRLNSLASKSSTKAGENMQLVIEFQNFEVPIVYSDIKYVPIKLHSFDQTSSVLNYDQSFNEITYTNLNMDILVNKSYFANSAPFDPDYIRDEEKEDPIEQKFRKLERVQHLSPLDKDLKPTLRMKAELSSIMRKQFFEKLTAKERNMVWRYRWFMLNMLIVGNPGMNNAIINFIKCVDWNNVSEIKEVEMILGSIEENLKLTSNTSRSFNSESKLDFFISKLQIVDCLELLSSNYRNSIVRNMAVKRLKSATDAELEIFMVQLVQSIKNEAFSYETSTSLTANEDSQNESELPRVEEEEVYAKPPISGGTNSNITITSSEYQMVDNYVDNYNPDLLLKEFIDNVLFKHKKTYSFTNTEISSNFINFLLSRVISNAVLTNYFYWNLKVELEDEIMRCKGNPPIFSLKADILDNPTNSSNDTMRKKIYQTTMKKFIMLLYTSHNGRVKLFELRRQIELVGKLHDFCYKIKVEHRKETTPRKLEILKSLLVEKHKRTVFGSKHEPRNQLLDDAKSESMVEFPPIALPLDPTVSLDGTFYEESAVFKSSLNPLKITFRTVGGGRYPVMYKIGDDLKQDQFVTQIISLMEKILAGENMDLKLKPYKILATGKVEGFIQFIPNNSLSHILGNYNNSILQYLQTFNPDPTSHLGVVPQVMDNYIRSCAGYCVVTYILGVGDRHLENLLLSKDGHFFHADFGYILGQDPKPFPPLMKLPVQIIEGMGGLDDVNYKTFCQYCFITYITLRKNAYLILNLVQLMINTSIPALTTSIDNSETEKMELLWKVEEKFMLDMNDEEAVLHFQNLIDSSVNAVLPVVIDRLHNLAQYWRS